MDMEMVNLRNGSQEGRLVVATTMMALTMLWNEGVGGVLAVYDLRQICRGKKGKVSEKTIKKLEDAGLVEPDGSVHGCIRNVVLSALEGESFETALVSPIARPNTSKPSAPRPEKSNG